MFPKHANILVIDDSAASLEGICACLRELGYSKVVEATDGVKGLLKLTAAEKAGTPFDLVVTDWVMPYMSGLEFLKRVRSMTEFGELPVVMVTVKSEVSEVIAALNAGISGYLVKPVTQEALKECLASTWRRLGRT